MALNCYFQYESGRFCKKFAMTGSRFCNNHQPRGQSSEGQLDPAGWPQLHPHLRLATPNDLFDLVRETLHATRTGAVTPSQAFAIGSLSTIWLRVYDNMLAAQRLRALQRQILPSMVDMEFSEAAEREARLAEDALHRAATEPAPLDRRNPWAAGQMAGDPSAHGLPPSLEPDGAQAPTLPPQAHAEGEGPQRDSDLRGNDSHPSAQRQPINPREAQADAASAVVPQTQRHRPDFDSSLVPDHSSLPSEPINLREAQAKLEAMLATQAAGKAPPKPNGGSV